MERRPQGDRVPEPRGTRHGQVRSHGLEALGVGRASGLEPGPGDVAFFEDVARFLESIAGGIEVRPSQAAGRPASEADVVDVLHEVGADPLGQLRVAARNVADGRQHQARGIQDRAERADPREVVVARPKEVE
jgi:hypothetical protein